MTDLQLINGGKCEVCGAPAKARVPLYKLVRGNRITTGKWVSSCFDCLTKVENMTNSEDKE